MMSQYPCPACGNIFYSNIALVNHQCNKTISVDTKTFYHPTQCPKCDKKMYSYLSNTMKIIQSICFSCGFYWSNSGTYSMCKELETIIIKNPDLLKTITRNQTKINW